MNPAAVTWPFTLQLFVNFLIRLSALSASYVVSIIETPDPVFIPTSAAVCLSGPRAPSLFITGTWNSLWQWLFMKGWREKQRQLQHMVTWWLCRGCENINLPSLSSSPVFCAANLFLPIVSSRLMWFGSRDTTLMYKYMTSTVVHHLIAHGIYSYYVRFHQIVSNFE